MLVGQKSTLRAVGMDNLSQECSVGLLGGTYGPLKEDENSLV